MNKYEALAALWRKRARDSEAFVEKYLPICAGDNSQPNHETMGAALAETYAYRKCAKELEETMKQEETDKPKCRMICDHADECDMVGCELEEPHDESDLCAPNVCSHIGAVVQCVPVEDNKP